MKMRNEEMNWAESKEWREEDKVQIPEKRLTEANFSLNLRWNFGAR